MADIYGLKKNKFKLINKKLEPSLLFDSIINRLPDLCMPPVYRWAGENDFFGCTKDIKLKPFRNQRIFETCISPDLDSSPSLDLLRGGTRSCRTTPTPGDAKVRRKLEPRPRSVTERLTNRPDETVQTSLKIGQTRRRDKLSKEQLLLRRKLELREAIKRRYSKLKVKRRLTDERFDSRIGFDRLFTKSPVVDYPYLNPIPDCMMTADNIDNLREIIVSAVDIEWKMLTPVRPHNEYEEKYFDRLIQLHRCRHKARLESGYYTKHLTVPFKHIRHTFLVHYDKHTPPPITIPTMRRKSYYHPLRKQSEAGTLGKPNIPTLTVSSDGNRSEKIVHSDHEGKQEDRFAYDQYSRFSKQNLRNAGSINLISREDRGGTNDGRAGHHQDLDFDDEFEDRVEEILNRLVNTNVTD